MATCDLTTLQTDACTNGFACVDPGSSDETALELQLLKEASNNTQTLEQIKEAACTNRFSCLKPGSQDALAVEFQLWCEAISATGG